MSKKPVQPILPDSDDSSSHDEKGVKGDKATADAEDTSPVSRTEMREFFSTLIGVLREDKTIGGKRPREESVASGGEAIAPAPAPLPQPTDALLTLRPPPHCKVCGLLCFARPVHTEKNHGKLLWVCPNYAKNPGNHKGWNGWVDFDDRLNPLPPYVPPVALPARLPLRFVVNGVERFTGPEEEEDEDSMGAPEPPQKKRKLEPRTKAKPQPKAKTRAHPRHTFKCLECRRPCHPALEKARLHHILFDDNTVDVCVDCIYKQLDTADSDDEDEEEPDVSFNSEDYADE